MAKRQLTNEAVSSSLLAMATDFDPAFDLGIGEWLADFPGVRTSEEPAWFDSVSSMDDDDPPFDLAAVVKSSSCLIACLLQRSKALEAGLR